MSGADKTASFLDFQPAPLVWTFSTPNGWVGAARSEAGLMALTLPQPSLEECACNLTWLGINNGCPAVPPEPGHILDGLDQALNRYFSGEIVKLDFPVDWSVFTPFQQRVLQVVQGLRYGALLSYGQVAALAGYPRAARAVGGALGANRILLVIPCHRVIRGDGTMGGFGCGLTWKESLLAIEGLHPGCSGRYQFA